MTISIIIPLFNRANLISATLQSVKAQTYKQWECIVVDDGSTDNSREIAGQFCREDARFQLHTRPDDRPKGANACRNYGLELAKGDFICFLDSDDLFYPDKLEFQHQVLTSASESVVASITQAINFEGEGKEAGLWKTFEESGKWPEDVIRKNLSWSPAAPLWRRSSLKAGSFSEDLTAGQDYEFHVKQALLYPRESFVFHDKVSVQVRADNPSIGRSEGAGRHIGYLSARLKVLHFMLSRQIKDRDIQHFLLEYGEKQLIYLFSITRPAVFSSSIRSYLSAYWKIDKFGAIKKTAILMMILITGKGHRFLIR